MIILYVIAALIVLVWGTAFVLRGSLLAGCLVYVVTAACFGHHFLHFDLGPIPLTLDRLVFGGLLVTYVVQWKLGRTDPKPIGRGEVLLLALLGVLMTSGSLAGWRSYFPGDNPLSPVYRLLAGYLIPCGLFWFARQAPLGRREISLLLGTLTCLGVYLAVTGLLEITGQWWAVFPKHIADPDVGLHFGRARGPMVHSVTYGACLATCLAAAWMWRWRFGRWGTLVLAALVPLMLAGIYFSYTRSVWMGTGLAAMIVLGLTLRGSWRPMILGTLVAGAAVLLATRLDKLVRFQREYSAAETADSVELRGAFAYLSWQMFLDRPLWGAGFGQFPEAKLDYLSDRSTGLNLEATRRFVHHNGLLSVLTETGLIGMVLLLAVLGSWAHTGWLLYRGADVPGWVHAQGVLTLAVLAIYVCQMAFHELTYSPIDNSMLFLITGVAAGLRPLVRPAGASAPAAATRWVGSTRRATT